MSKKEFWLWTIAFLLLSLWDISPLFSEEPAKAALPKLTPREIYDKAKYGVAIVYTYITIEKIESNFPFGFGNSESSTKCLPEKFEVVVHNKNSNSRESFSLILEKVANSNNKLRSSGSGWFVDKDGTLVTDMHVVRQEDDKLETMFGTIAIKEYTHEVQILDRRTENKQNGPRQKSYHAEFLGSDSNNDTSALKVLNINARDYEVLKRGDSNLAKTTDEVFSLGAPAGFADSFSAPGIVSKTHRTVGMWLVEDFLQLTLPLHPGNSGSPVFNDRGEVIGMVDLGLRGGGDSMSFAIPANLINVERLKTNKGKVIKKLDWGADVLIENFILVGTPDNLDIQDLNEINSKTKLPRAKTLHTLAGISDNNSAIIIEVKTESIAEKAGLKPGDVITKVKDKEIHTGMELRIALTDLLPNEEFDLVYQRVDENGLTKETLIKFKLD